MRKTRKTIALMFATVMAMSAMSGCSSNSANTTTSAETKADDTKAEDRFCNRSWFFCFKTTCR